MVKLQKRMSITFSAKNDEAVDFNCSNNTAFMLLELLQIEAGYSGSILTAELANRLTAARLTLWQRPTEFAVESHTSKGTNGATIIQAGISPERFLQYLDRLQLITKYALAKQIRWITWA